MVLTNLLAWSKKILLSLAYLRMPKAPREFTSVDQVCAMKGNKESSATTAVKYHDHSFTSDFSRLRKSDTHIQYLSIIKSFSDL